MNVAGGGPTEPNGVEGPSSREDVRHYYRTVSRFIELELAERGDEDYWSARVEELGRPRILELGAGTGRVTRVLAEGARILVALDISSEMLARAQRELEGRKGVHLVRSDMCEAAFDAVFDLVVAANDPFVHLAADDERDRAIRCAARHLRPGGLLVLDLHRLPRDRQREAASPEGWRRERRLGEHGSELSVVEWWKHPPGEPRATVRFEYRRRDEVVGRAELRPRLWTEDELGERLPAAGLEIRRILGGYHGEPWDPDGSSRFVVEAVRR